jgi:hypothetical protein
VLEDDDGHVCYDLLLKLLFEIPHQAMLTVDTLRNGSVLVTVVRLQQLQELIPSTARCLLNLRENHVWPIIRSGGGTKWSSPLMVSSWEHVFKLNEHRI